MSLYEICHWLAREVIVPLSTAPLRLVDSTLAPAGDLADWMESSSGLNVVAWGVAVNVAMMVGMVNLILMVYLERKIAARLMDRRGPMLTVASLGEIFQDLMGRMKPSNFRRNYLGIGFMQNIADGLKLFCKELIIPAKADRLLFTLGPVIIIASTFLLFVTVPLSDRFAASAVPGGLLLVMAVFAVAPVGILTSGWASNNKYTLIGGMRSAAQLMAYEIPLLLSMAGVFLLAGSYAPVDIVHQQQQGTWLFGLPVWNVIPQFIGFVVFLICIIAEIERVPFDLPEAESELVEGWTTEYGGIRFALFLAVEYIRGFIGAAVAVILFFGGWAGPLLPPEIWFLIKVYIIYIFFVVLRWTVPRIRTDQILMLGWKRLLPLALLNLALVIAMVELHPILAGVF